MSNNPALYDAALIGFVSGYANSRFSTSDDESIYANLIAAGAVFAAAVDSNIAPAGVIPESNVDAMTQISAGFMASRYGSDLTSSDYTAFAKAVATLFVGTVSALEGVSGGGGITELTGDVLAGPGTGSQVAEVVSAAGGALTIRLIDSSLTLDTPSGDATEVTSEGVLQFLYGLTVGGGGANGGLLTGSGVNLGVGATDFGGGANVFSLGFSSGPNPAVGEFGDIFYVPPSAVDPTVDTPGNLRVVTSNGVQPTPAGMDFGVAPGVQGVANTQTLVGGVGLVSIGTTPLGGGTIIVSVPVPSVANAVGRIELTLIGKLLAPGTVGGAVGDGLVQVLGYGVKSVGGVPAGFNGADPVPAVIEADQDVSMSTGIAIAFSAGANAALFTITCDATCGQIDWQAMADTFWN